MTADPIFHATIDPTRNLLRARFTGQMSAEEMKVAAEQMETLLPTLTPGFTMLADFSQVSSMDLDCVPHLTRLMDLHRAHKIGLVVRVLPPPESDIGINILSVVPYRGEVKTMTAETLEEAEQVVRRLDQT